jgi:hypothetical protein
MWDIHPTNNLHEIQPIVSKENLMKTALSTLLLILATPFLTAAEIAVQLTGSDWATADNALGNGNSVMNATNIQPGSGYTGPALLGGAVATDTIIGSWSIGNNAGSNALAGLDVFRLSIGNTVNQANNKFHHAVVFFDQSVFSNGLDSVAGGVTLDDTTTLSYTAKRTSGDPSEIGYVIQADGNYYLHNIAYNDSQAGAGQGHVFTLTDPTAVAWNSFDPTTSLSPIGAAATPDFTKVTGIGLWFENERVGSSTSGLSFAVGEITINAIPEPSTFALVGIALGSLLLFRRRKA